jgi:hypothetical protein
MSFIIDGTNGITFPNSSLQDIAAYPAANNCIYENEQTVTANYTMTAGRNGQSCGPITIDTGVEVTIPTGSFWTIS